MPGFTDRQRPRLAIHLCLHKWHCITHATIQQGTPWCLDGRWAPKEPLWLSPPVTSMEVTTMWGVGALLMRTECGDQSFGIWLWGAATLGCSCHRWSCLRPCHEVDLCSMKSRANSTTSAPSPISSVKPQPTITETLNLHIQGALEQLQQTSPATSMPVSQHSIPRRKLPSAALGAPPCTRVEDPLRLEGADSATPEPMATSL